VYEKNGATTVNYLAQNTPAHEAAVRSVPERAKFGYYSNCIAFYYMVE
jgi:hypothetical protein